MGKMEEDLSDNEGDNNSGYLRSSDSASEPASPLPILSRLELPHY